MFARNKKAAFRSGPEGDIRMCAVVCLDFAPPEHSSHCFR